MLYNGIIRKVEIKNKSNIDKYIFLLLEIDNTTDNINYLNSLFLKNVSIDIQEGEDE
jgi:hypothetical protein